MARFQPVASLERTWDRFLQAPAYVLLRTLAYLALVFTAFLVFFVIVAIVFGTTIAIALLAGGTGTPPTAAMLAGLGLPGIIIVTVAALIFWFFAATIQLGLVRSLLRYVITGETRYDLFAPPSKTLQYMLFGVAIITLVALFFLAAGSLAVLEPIIALILAVIVAFAFLWIAFQLVFVPYRLFSKDENVFEAASGSYRMLAGNRGSFVLVLLGLSVAIGVASSILQLIPLIGPLASPLVSFVLTALGPIWFSIVHEQLDPTRDMH